MSNIVPGNSLPEIQAFIKANPSTLCVFFNWTSWNEPSVAIKEVLAELAPDFPSARFYAVDADVAGAAEVCGAVGLTAMPSVTAFAHGKMLGCVAGFNPAETVAMVAAAAATAAATPAAAVTATAGAAAPAAAAAAAAAEPAELSEAALRALTTQAPVMLFMKGAPEAPRCGFSRQIVELLNGAGVKFGSFDILSDQRVREGLKKLSNWPTYPQLYAEGELLGGLDVVKELAAAGELLDSVPESARV